jgi:hypothetical protein
MGESLCMSDLKGVGSQIVIRRGRYDLSKEGDPNHIQRRWALIRSKKEWIHRVGLQ